MSSTRGFRAVDEVGWQGLAGAGGEELLAAAAEAGQVGGQVGQQEVVHQGGGRGLSPPAALPRGEAKRLGVVLMV